MGVESFLKVKSMGVTDGLDVMVQEEESRISPRFLNCING